MTAVPNVHIRRSRKSSIVTGATSANNTREQIATIRPPTERKAMSPIARRAVETRGIGQAGGGLLSGCARLFWQGIHSFCKGVDRCLHGGTKRREIGMRKKTLNESVFHSGGQGFEDWDDDSLEERMQYTLTSRSGYKSLLPFQRFRQNFCYCCSRSTIATDDTEGEDSHIFFIDINKRLSDYFSWAYRTSYFLMFMAFGFFYYFFIVGFAGIFSGIALHTPECITSAGLAVGSGQDASIWADCFQLSWTTFSTVGYGIVYPATGASQENVPSQCIIVGIVGSFEAYMGVLYAGFCGAILFGKVTRAQSRAQVYFSDPIVVRFGKKELKNNHEDESEKQDGPTDVDKGNEEEKEEEGEVDEEMGGRKKRVTFNEDDVQAKHEKNIPCPSLEFRLVNRLHGVPAGEIVEAQLSCVAILDPKNCDKDIVGSVSGLSLSSDSSALDDSDSEHEQQKINEETTIADLAKILQQNENKRALRGLAFHSDTKQPRVFTKLTLDAPEHPFFRRVWFGRHKLDENSPLLSKEARKKIKKNGGYWPAEFNNYKSIQQHLHFRHLLVSIGGTSNANATSVYEQKTYDRIDVNVGYRFVPMNFHEESGKLRTDPYLLNAVYQQRGGGAEPM